MSRFQERNKQPKKVGGEGEEGQSLVRCTDDAVCDAKEIGKIRKGERRIKCCGASTVGRGGGRSGVIICAELSTSNDGVELANGG